MSTKIPKDIEITEPAILTPLTKLSKDVKEAASLLGRDEVRFIVDTYYTLQEHRIAMEAQTRSLTGKPHEVISFFAAQSRSIESQAKSVLDAYSSHDKLGRWARSIVGIGPVLSAALLAHIDLTKAPHYGNVWSFAGLNPTQKWIGRDGGAEAVAEAMTEADDDINEAVILVAAKLNRNIDTIRRMATTNKAGEKVELSAKSLASAIAKRPWNASLKVVTWKIGESFVKTSGSDDSFYGKMYAKRKSEEIMRNVAGDFAEQAAGVLREKKIGKSTEAYKHYSKGQLPPAHVHARAKRYAVKLFLSHYWQVGREILGFATEAPYPIAHLGHTDIIPPPNWPMQE